MPNNIVIMAGMRKLLATTLQLAPMGVAILPTMGGMASSPVTVNTGIATIPVASIFSPRVML